MVSEDHCSPRTDVLAEEMLQDVRMAAMRKLQCSVVRSGQSPVWAVRPREQVAPSHCCYAAVRKAGQSPKYPMLQS